MMHSARRFRIFLRKSRVVRRETVLFTVYMHRFVAVWLNAELQHVKKKVRSGRLTVSGSFCILSVLKELIHLIQMTQERRSV